MKVLSTLLLITLLGSCSYHYEEVNSIGYANGELVHTVFLSLKEEVTEIQTDKIKELLNSLSEIEVTKGLTVSSKALTNDPRANTDYDLVLQMSFKNLQHLESYRNDSYHLEVRSQLKDDLANAPLVYDYWVEQN